MIANKLKGQDILTYSTVFLQCTEQTNFEYLDHRFVNLELSYFANLRFAVSFKVSKVPNVSRGYNYSLPPVIQVKVCKIIME